MYTHNSMALTQQLKRNIACEFIDELPFQVKPLISSLWQIILNHFDTSIWSDILFRTGEIATFL